MTSRVEEEALRQEAAALDRFKSAARSRPSLPPRRPASPPPPPRPRPAPSRPNQQQERPQLRQGLIGDKGEGPKTTWLMPPPTAARVRQGVSESGDLITLSHSSSAPKFLAMKASLNQLYSMSNEQSVASKSVYSRSQTSPLPTILTTSTEGFRARQSGFNETVVRPNLSINWMGQHGLQQQVVQQQALQHLQSTQEGLPTVRPFAAPRGEEAVLSPTSTKDFVTTLQVEEDGMVKSMSWTDTNPLCPTSPSNSKLAIRGSVSDFSLMSKQSDDEDKSLIYLGPYNLKSAEQKLTRVGVLEAFDPLLMADEDDWPDNFVSETNKEKSADNCYSEYDPFEYMAQHEDAYEQTPETTTTASNEAPTPIRASKLKEELGLVNNLRESIRKEQDVAVDSEIEAFAKMASEIRAKFKHSDAKSNVGLVKSARIQAVYPPDASLKIVVHAPLDEESRGKAQSISFTCVVGTSVEHLVYKALSDFESVLDQNSFKDEESFYLRVPGALEYLDGLCKLQDYQYVHQCYKFDQDVELVLEPKSRVVKMYQRTAEDDARDSVVKVTDVSPKDSVKTLSHDNLIILLETLENECDRFGRNVEYLVSSEETNVFHTLRPKQLLQAVKAVCAFLGNIELLEVREVCRELVELCLSLDEHKGNDGPDGQRSRPDIVEEVGEHLERLSVSSSSPSGTNYGQSIKAVVNKLKIVVKHLVHVYSKTFRVNFSVHISEDQEEEEKKLYRKESIEVSEPLSIRVCSLHRLDPEWNFDDYQLSCQVYHGSRPIAEAVHSSFRFVNNKGFYPCTIFDQWLESVNVKVSALPREARLVLSLRGRKSEVGRDSRDILSTRLYDLGWTALQLFNHENILAKGTYVLSLWPLIVEKQLGPAPDSGSHPRAHCCPVISVELPDYNALVNFPDKIPIMMVDKNRRDINELDYYTKEQLIEICTQDLLTFTDLPSYQRDSLYNKRFYLLNEPSALPKVLLAAKSWQYDQLPQLYGLMHSWRGLEAMHLLQLFLPCFPDGQVRECAVDWLGCIHNDELLQYLPQLLEAYKHDTFAVSPLAKLLLSKALEAPRIAHTLYWLLTQSLPGLTPQNTIEEEDLSSSGSSALLYHLARYRRRLQMLMRALYTVVGSAVRSSFCRQQQLIRHLHNAAVEVQRSRSTDVTTRNLTLRRTLGIVGNFLKSDPTTLPLSPSLIAFDLEVEICSYFNSNTVPLKLIFVTDDTKASHNSRNDYDAKNSPKAGLSTPVIFKVGDDLRQDMLTLQMIRVMDQIWLKENLDLKMVTFACVPTGRNQGVIEMVRDAKTLREIQVMSSGSVTGSFRETPLYQWLQKYNQSPLEFARAVDNFTRSCAGYSIVTYILGVCDRHNDNIMVKQSGHMLHIDFGKFLGDAQLFGNIKRDRAPFVLTPDMAYVINGGLKASHRFHAFVDLCCTGFNLVRKHGNMLLNLFTLMASSGIPGVSLDAVRYVQRALLPDLSEAEAATTFARMIEESLASWFTQFNFFIHNLGQMRFANEQENGELLSFVPKRYTMKSEGRIEAVTVYAIQKRYEPEKHYVFILRIEREGLKDAVFLFRSYKEFCELDSKISKAFPVMQSHSLRRTTLGRQEIRNVAERRKHAIGRFLIALFTCADESVAHSDLVYTFFHPLLRDQQEADVHIRKLRHEENNNEPQLKLAIYYSKDTLHVLVCHGRNLADAEEPNCYVKVYLYPDPSKATKRKTKVVRKNAHPSFMEMLEYRLPLDRVLCRSLQVSVWNYDRFQENVFLGAVIVGLDQIDLGDHTPKWHTLTPLNQRS